MIGGEGWKRGNQCTCLIGVVIGQPIESVAGGGHVVIPEWNGNEGGSQLGRVAIGKGDRKGGRRGNKHT